ncbi:ATP-binding protein [Pseudonocardia sp. RS010]|uniref:ATP-binding protein n=1 Tax=Pseudonocardia sp. RS010 TaxID=3385979 RepID=UPI0039A04522
MTSATALRATIDLPAIPRSVPAARGVLAQLLSAWAAEPLREHAELLVSELVTNVIRHVGGDAALQVEVQLTAPVLRVTVADSS